MRTYPLPLLALLLALFLLVRVSPAAAQGYSPDEAAARMTVAEGFEVTVVAAEPLVRQPVAIEFDDRGRLWVIQYLQYPNPAGLTRVAVDRYSRTVYDRVPEPPPQGPRGADRITILEDADGDGRMDVGRDFIDGLNLATGLAFGHGGLFVLNVPYLLFYPDLDRDDVPDGDPRVLLSGFGMQDAHSVANSLAFGPDGWLYGCQGSTVTANVRGIEFQQGVWRYHPLRDEFELFCEGGGNSWGLDFDSRGQLLYSTNYGNHVALHALQGGYCIKSFSKHGALHNPHAYGYFDHLPHANFRGGHVTAGGVLYEEELFPPAFRGRYIAADLLGHGVYWHDVSARGSTFSTAHGGELLVANDAWFAPCDVTIGPDGAVYVADWHDARTAHPDPDADWDRTNGRIYRIAPRDAAENSPTLARAAATLPDFHALPSDGLVDLLGSASQWRVRRARAALAERSDPAAWPRLREQAATAADERLSLESLWAFNVSGGWDDAVALTLLDSPHEHVRAWTVRLLGDARQLSPAAALRLDRLAEADSSVVVRCQLAATALRLPAEQALPIVHSIVLRDEDSADPCLPLLLWWAVERHSIAAPEAVLSRFARPAAFDTLLSRETILPRLVRRYAAEGTTDAWAYCQRLIFAAPDEQRRLALLGPLDEGLRSTGAGHLGPGGGDLYRGLATDRPTSPAEGSASSSAAKRETRLPDALQGLIEDGWRADRENPLLLRLAARTGVEAAFEFALAQAADAEVPSDRRVAMLAVLGELAEARHLPPLLAIVAADVSSDVQPAAISTLARFDDERVAPALLAAYPRWSEAVRGRAGDLLLSRSGSAALLLDAVDAGAIQPAEVSLEQLRRVALLGDEALDARVRRRWGNIAGGTPEEKLAEMRRLSNDLRAAAGDAAAGQLVFKKHCASCHQLFGEGTRIGPDLTAANRQDRDYLLLSLVDPSAVVRAEYLNYVLQTTDGRVLTGLVVEQTPAGVTLLDAKNARTAVPATDADLLEESPVSLMPENLHRQLTPQDLRDLFAYLQK